MQPWWGQGSGCCSHGSRVLSCPAWAQPGCTILLWIVSGLPWSYESDRTQVMSSSADVGPLGVHGQTFNPFQSPVA